MPDFNLSALSLADLRDLQKSVAKAISTFEARQKAEARDKVEMLAKDLGFTLAELGGTETKAHARPLRRTTGTQNPTLTWSGRGRKPQWFVDALAAGKSKDDLGA